MANYRRIAVLAIGTLLSAGALAACHPDHGEIALYRNGSFDGARRAFEGNDGTYTDNDFDDDGGASGPLNDQVSSMRNSKDEWFIGHIHADYQGPAICVAPNTEVHNLHGITYGGPVRVYNFGDELSSHYRTVGQPLPVEQGGPCTKTVG